MNYKRIKDDFDSGVLNKDADLLVIDQDSCWLESRDTSLTDDEKDAKYEEYKSKYGRGNGEFDFNYILSLYGIPNE